MGRQPSLRTGLRATPSPRTGAAGSASVFSSFSSLRCLLPQRLSGKKSRKIEGNRDVGSLSLDEFRGVFAGFLIIQLM